MPAVKARYKTGDVVLAHLDEDRGKRKLRWMLVLSELRSTGDRSFYICVAISTTFPEPPPAINIPLPWHPAGHVSTGLRKRSAVVLDWVRRMPPESIIHAEGYITSALLEKINRAIELRSRDEPQINSG